MSDAHVSYAVDGHVATIAITRPRAMNAMNAQTRRELADAMAKAEANDDVRIVVLTGSGRAFSSGTDLKEAASPPGPMGAFDNSIRDYKPLVDAVTESDKIYLAAINGVAGGVALGLALGADLAVMSEDATIFSPFANIGLVPDGGASFFLLHHLGYKRAFAAIAECTRMDARTCLDLGLVNKVVSGDELADAAAEWAASLARRAPLSLRWTKKILREAASLGQAGTARLESEFQNKAINSEDARTAILAFLNKETPTFQGK